jgi:tellurite resistance protein TehA-like permease
VGVRGDSGLWLHFFGMLVFLPGAAGLLWGLLGPLLPWLPPLDEGLRWFAAAFGAFLTLLGCYALYKWRRIRRAVRLVTGG